MTELISILIYPWQVTAFVSAILWFIYWDNHRSEIEMEKLIEISGCAYGILLAFVACAKMIFDKACYTEVDEMGLIVIGAIWSFRNLSGTLKKTLGRSKP